MDGELPRKEMSDATSSPHEIAALKRRIQELMGWNDLELHKWWICPNRHLADWTPRQLSRDKRAIPFLYEFIEKVLTWPSY